MSTPANDFFDPSFRSAHVHYPRQTLSNNSLWLSSYNWSTVLHPEGPSLITSGHHLLRAIGVILCSLVIWSCLPFQPLLPVQTLPFHLSSPFAPIASCSFASPLLSTNTKLCVKLKSGHDELLLRSLLWISSQVISELFGMADIVPQDLVSPWFSSLISCPFFLYSICPSYNELLSGH